MVRKVVLLCWLLLGCISASGQLRMAYYDVDRLCDTLPSLFYYDPYTPDGPNRWNTARYRHKVEQVAAVIDSMGLEIVALYGVENEAVVRDIIRSSRQDYSYYHTTLNASDGMDFALLYYGDKLEVLETEAGPRSLRIEARIRRDTVTLLLVADRRRCANEVQACCNRHPNRPLIVAGRTGYFRGEQWGLVERTAHPRRQGYGTRYSRRGWYFGERIYTSPTLGTAPAEVFIRREWLDPTTATPLPTWQGASYRGGVGRNLPVWCRIE